MSKGSTRGGVCARGVCAAKPATHFNVSTRRWYCVRCADLLNHWAPRLVLEAKDDSRTYEQWLESLSPDERRKAGVIPGVGNQKQN